MMKSVFWNKVLLICVFGCLLGCTYDTNVNLTDSIVEETNEKRPTRPIILVNKTIEALVVFKKGTSEAAKRKIKYKYKSSGLLLSWELCGFSSASRSESNEESDDNDDGDDEEQIEIWVLDYEMYNEGDPVVLIETDNEDIERFIAYANCKDYKGN